MKIVAGRTALVITDPQNNILMPDGVTWAMLGKNVTVNNTVANIESLFKVAKANDIPFFYFAALFLANRPWLEIRT